MKEYPLTILRIEFFDHPNHCFIYELRYVKETSFGSQGHFYFRGVGSSKNPYEEFPSHFDYQKFNSLQEGIHAFINRMRKHNFYFCGLKPYREPILDTDILPNAYQKMALEIQSVIEFKPQDLKHYQFKTMIINWEIGKMKFLDSSIDSTPFEEEVKNKIKDWEDSGSRKQWPDFILNEAVKNHFGNEYLSIGELH